MFDDAINGLYAAIKKSIADYSGLETTSGRYTFVFDDSTMATVLSYSGIKGLCGKEELMNICKRLAEVLNPFFLKEAYELQFVLNRDIMQKKEMKRRLQPVYDTATRIGMLDTVADILDEQAEVMANVLMDDDCVIVLYTHHASLRKEEYSEWAKEQVRRRKMGDLFIPQGTQNTSVIVDPMQALHTAFTEEVLRVLNQPDIGASIEALDAEQASNVIARLVDPLGISHDWQAWVTPMTEKDAVKRHALLRSNDSIFKPAPGRITKSKPEIKQVGNIGIFFPPPLKDQVLTQEAKYNKSGYLEYGGRLYSTLTQLDPPTREVTGTHLVNALFGLTTRVNDVVRPVPYRLNLRIRAHGVKQFRFRQMVSPLFAAASDPAGRLMRASKALTEERKKDFAMASVSMSITTWVDAHETDATQILKGRVVALRSATSTWGNFQAVEATLDRAEALISSIPCLTTKPCSNEATGTLIDVLPLFPLVRPASPLENQGTDFYRALDGTILPIEQHSKLQSYWLETFTAPMGGGKSAQANRKHWEYILKPGRTELPYLHCVDIGGSVSGVVEMLYDVLPPSMKHLVYMHTLLNNESNAINMIDQKPGLRMPMEGDLSTTVEWLTALVTPAERGGMPYENMTEFCRVILMAAYRKKSDLLDGASPNRFDYTSSDKDVQKVYTQLEFHRLKVPPRATWFHVCDMLAEVEDYEGAIIAHRQASPTLLDLMTIAGDENTVGNFMAAKTESDVPIPHAFRTQLSLATESYPIFNARTRLDLRGRRITAIDLAHVAKGDSAAGVKQASLMYMVAYEMFARNIRMSDTDFDEGMSNIPKAWHRYYAKERESIKNSDKHATFDEYHRTKIAVGETDIAKFDASGIRATLVREGGREARKWGLSLTTISQLTKDHGALLTLGSAHHILQLGGSEEFEYQKHVFNLSPIDQRYAQLNLNGPVPGVGANMLSVWVTKKGTFKQGFTSTIGPKMLWSLSTTFEDKVIRSTVYEHIGREAGRAVLAKVYRGGSAASEVDRRKKSAINISDDVDPTMGAAKQIAHELIAMYRNDPTRFNA